MYLKPTEPKSRNYAVTQDEHWSKYFRCKGNLQEGNDIPTPRLCMEWKPLSDLERRLGFRLLILWVKTGDDGLPKMFKGIITKEYPIDHIDCRETVVISQRIRIKDSEDKQPVQGSNKGFGG